MFSVYPFQEAYLAEEEGKRRVNKMTTLPVSLYCVSMGHGYKTMGKKTMFSKALINNKLTIGDTGHTILSFLLRTHGNELCEEFYHHTKRRKSELLCIFS